VRRVGIDIALKAAHKAAVFDGAERRGRPFPVPQTKEGVDELVRRGTADGSEPCEFVMEPTGLAWLPLAAELSRRNHKVFAPKPQKTHALRKFLSQFAKSDGIDACTTARVRHSDPDKTHELQVPTAELTTLRLFVKHRARLVVEASRAKCRIHAQLVLANPSLGRALGSDCTTVVKAAFLRGHLDPFEVVARGKEALHAFWLSLAPRADEKQIDAVWTACETTCALYQALRESGRLPFSYGSMQLMIRQSLDHVAFLESQIGELDRGIAETYGTIDPTRLLEREVIGCGPTIAATIEAFAGHVEQFSSVKRYAAFFGLVPRAHQTGGDKGKPQRLSKGGNNLLKHYMFLAADAARRIDPTLAATYRSAVDRGKHHISAVVVVAHKLIRRVYAVLKMRAAARAGAAVEPRYRLEGPDGAAMTRATARTYVEEHFPSKAVRARRAANDAASQPKGTKRASRRAPQTGTVSRTTGSSEDATSVVTAARPNPFVAEVAAAQQPPELPSLALDRT
jgi:transposase